MNRRPASPIIKVQFHQFDEIDQFHQFHQINQFHQFDEIDDFWEEIAKMKWRDLSDADMSAAAVHIRNSLSERGINLQPIVNELMNELLPILHKVGISDNIEKIAKHIIARGRQYYKFVKEIPTIAVYLTPGEFQLEFPFFPKNNLNK